MMFPAGSLAASDHIKNIVIALLARLCDDPD
jgi:hypothetical protein